MADSHVGEHAARLPPAVLGAMSGVDLIVHAGDLSVAGVLDELGALAPVVAVRGNHDRQGVAARLPRDVVVRVGDVRIGVTHGHRGPLTEILHGAAVILTGRLPLGGFLRAARRRFGGVDAVVFGHLHVPVSRRLGGTLMFSPGAVYLPERDAARRFGRLEGRLYHRFRSACPPGSATPRIGVIEIGDGRVSARSVPLDGVAAAPGRRLPA